MHRAQRLLLDHRRLVAAALAGLAVLAALSSVRESTDGPTVLATAHDVASGVTLRADDVRTVRLAPGTRPRGALVRRADAVGRRVAGPMRRGELLTDRRVLGADPAAGRPDGTVLTTVRLADADGLGTARVGDVVDVVAVDPEAGRRARVVARRVEVVALRRDPDAEGALLDLATRERDALALAEAALAARLSVMVSTRDASPR